MDTLRVLIRWLESIDGVENDLHTKVLSPTLSDGDNVRDEWYQELTERLAILDEAVPTEAAELGREVL